MVVVRGIAASDAHARSYERAIRRIAVETWRHLEASTLPALRRAKTDRADDDDGDPVRRSLSELRRRLARVAADVQSDAEAIASEADRRHSDEWYRRVRSATGIDVVTTEGWRGEELDQWARQNAALIRSVHTGAVATMEREIEEAFAAGTRPEDLARRWRQRGLPLNFGTVEGRAKVIARDQLNKLNGRLSEMRQREAGVTEYDWRTSHDQRVRDEHASREGKRYQWDKPPPDGHPGRPVQCRCVADAVIDVAALASRAAGPSAPAPARAPRGPRQPQTPNPPPAEVMPRQVYQRPSVDEATIKAARRIFGRGVARLSDDELVQEILRTSGIPADGVSSMVITTRGDHLVMRTLTTSGGQVVRSFERQGNAVVQHNELFKPRYPPKSGIGAQGLARNVEAATRLGVTRMLTLGARDDGEYNGYATWPVCGYDGPLNPRFVARHRATISQLLGRPIGASETVMVSQLHQTAEGIDFWKINGGSIELEFDLSTNSDSRRVLAAYRRRKQLRNDLRRAAAPRPCGRSPRTRVAPRPSTRRVLPPTPGLRSVPSPPV